ncbi:uncharacterized protein LOC132561075 [Ylistrum balloti]|uniref:uncharacterized protein LOC132561075 n=1 Tax=Ylistrum balloti TaxID=509963 RepID=UPI0029059AA5|nr:uncharacterized protein LOC132561075 [Ylistrum balloti]
MDVGVNTSTVVPGIETSDPGVGTRCNTTYVQLCTDESSFLAADLLQFAPCPPPWKKGLLWEVAKQKGLTDNEAGQIAFRCVVSPTASQTPELCGSSCIAICVLSGCLLLTIILAVVCWCRRRGVVKKLRTSNQNKTDNVQAAVGTRKPDPAYDEFQEGRVHYRNIMESAFDNLAYTTDFSTDHVRSNSDTSNNSHTQLNGTSTNQNYEDAML